MTTLRQHFIFGLAMLATLFAPAVSAQDSRDAPLIYIEPDSDQGRSAAVLVPDAELVFSPQQASDASSKDSAGDQIADSLLQARECLDLLAAWLASADARIEDCVRIHWYVRDAAAAESVTKAMRERFAGKSPPAMTLVQSPLPAQGVNVAVDAVARREPQLEGKAITPRVQRLALGPVAVLPKGGRVFVSGQAEPGELLEATRKTLESLSRTLASLGRTDDDIVQLKCFLHPIDRLKEVERVINEHFGRSIPPPTSYVGWSSTLPIEIELVAWGGPADDKRPAIEFITPPDFTSSPLFSRVSRTNRGDLVFFGDITGMANDPAEAQLRAAFDRLKLLCEKCGTDLASLAKATYYVTDDAAGRAHNEIRPRFYDPKRPPAASKALVAGTGRTGLVYTMDMIASPSSHGVPPSPAERGRGLTEEEAVAGWLCLFDGESTFGWQGAAIDNGRLCGGKSNVRFGPCEVRVEFDGPGAVRMGKESAATQGGVVRLEVEKGAASIELDPQSRATHIAVLPHGLAPLFNGRDLDGWQRVDRPESREDVSWTVRDGRLRVLGGPGALEYVPGAYGNFVAQLDVRTRAVHSNGGFFFRAIPGDFINGYEAQLHNRAIDADPARPYVWATGGVDDRINPRRLVSRDFTPFRLTVLADGPRIATWVNGVQTVDWLDERQAHENAREGRREQPGAFQLQAHDRASDYEILGIYAVPLE